MTRRVPLPSEGEVRAAVDQLATDSASSPAVVAVARHLGLSNATFWRHFPQLAQAIADERRASRATTAMPRSVDTHDTKESEQGSSAMSARLRTENAQLRSKVEIASAHILRLTLENRHLRDELESAQRVARIQPPR